MSRLCVYVAGAYEDNGVCAIQANMRRGFALTIELLKAGYAPFCPWADFQFGLHVSVSREEYLEYSMAWLEKSDVVVCVPEGIEQSKGSQAERKRAKELGIDVYNNLQDFLKAQAKA